MDKKTILILFGGRSSEHEISVRSAASVIANLDPTLYEIIPLAIDKKGYFLSIHQSMELLPAETTKNLVEVATIKIKPEPLSMTGVDVVFPVLHGTFGEDGKFQGVFDLADAAYVGAGVLGSAVGMDKDVMKRLFHERDLPTVEHFALLRSNCLERIGDIEARFPYPVFIKPANLGSSVGITKASNRNELRQSLALAAKYDRKIIIEPAIVGREIECGVLGNDDPEVSVPGEVVTGEGFYDYEAKYGDKNSTIVIPAVLSDKETNQVRELALEAFKAVEGRGLARVDFFLEATTGKVLLNELNSMPGFTSISMYPKLWMATGLSYPSLLDRLIDLAIESHQENKRTLFGVE
tara:strand:+ start:25898 stop:26950 length:1053 start_codon:yes stop_codon:yes gene_type:complete